MIMHCEWHDCMYGVDLKINLQHVCCNFRDDNINTAYLDSNATQHSFVTTVESIITSNQSVSASLSLQ